MQCIAKACKSCRSRQEPSNEYLLAKFGFDKAENGALKFAKNLPKVSKYVRKKHRMAVEVREAAVAQEAEAVQAALRAEAERQQEAALRNEMAATLLKERSVEKKQEAVEETAGLFNRREAGRQPNFGGLVLGCIDADFCK